jgi:hypothetical protein
LYKDLTSQRLKIKRLKFNFNFFNYITSQVTKNTKDLRKLFSDPKSKKNFSKFLQIVLNKKYRNFIGSDFSFMPHNDLGYMTHYFFYQNVLRENYNMLFDPNIGFNKMIKQLDKKIFTNIFFKTENLSKDLQNFLKKSKIEIKNFKKIDKNSSSLDKDKNYLKFFSKKNMVLIEKKENYLFKKFKYKKLSKEKL